MKKEFERTKEFFYVLHLPHLKKKCFLKKFNAISESITAAKIYLEK
jgi:hypothetical protein